MFPVYRRYASAQPARGRTIAVVRADELYGASGRLFAGPLFQAIASDVRVYARMASASLRMPAVPPYADGKPAIVPVAALDACMQIAALWLMEHGYGACLPVAIKQAWWAGAATPKTRMSAKVWIANSADNKHLIFDGTVLCARKTIWSFKGLVMTPIKSA